MARGPKPQGGKALTVAERQARYRARHPGAPIIRFRRPAKRRSRAQRWREAVADLVALQDDYAAWLEAMPEDHARRCHRASPASHRRSRSRRDRRHRAAARLRARRHRVMTVVTAGATPLPGPHPRGLPRWVHRHPPRIAPPDSGAVAPRCAGPPYGLPGQAHPRADTITTPNQHLSPFLLSHDRGAVHYSDPDSLFTACRHSAGRRR